MVPREFLKDPSLSPSTGAAARTVYCTSPWQLAALMGALGTVAVPATTRVALYV